MNSDKRKQDNIYSARNIVAKEVCDTIIVNINEIFKYKGHLIASNFYLIANFKNYENNFSQL